MTPLRHRLHTVGLCLMVVLGAGHVHAQTPLTECEAVIQDQGWISCLAVQPSSNQLYYFSATHGTIRRWDQTASQDIVTGLPTGKSLVRTGQPTATHVRQMAFLNERTLVVAISGPQRTDNQLRFFVVEGQAAQAIDSRSSGITVALPDGLPDACWLIQIVPVGASVALGIESADEKLWLVDTQMKSPTNFETGSAMPIPAKNVTSFTISPSGEIVFSQAAAHDASKSVLNFYSTAADQIRLQLPVDGGRLHGLRYLERDNRSPLLFGILVAPSDDSDAKGQIVRLDGALSQQRVSLAQHMMCELPEPLDMTWDSKGTAWVVSLVGNNETTVYRTKKSIKP
ncbi:MAG: hypothetical protein R3C28_17130 [Pirellulaceae bacterium]